MKIANSADLLDLIKSRYSLPSDYAAAKFLGISKARVSNYRIGKNSMDQSLILRIETLLKYPPGSLLFEMQAARTKCPDAAKIFHQTAQKIAAGVLCFMLVFPVFFTVPASPAGQFVPLHTVYYVKLFTPLYAHPNELGFFPYLCFFTLFFVNALYCNQIANLSQNDDS